MKKLKHIIFTLLLSIVIIGCSSSTPEPEEIPTQEPTEEVVQEPTIPPPTPTSEPEMVDNCVDCHTDKDRLISTAKPVVEVHSENEGAG